jgi:uncharacterized protein YodC (DUF2158 family)
MEPIQPGDVVHLKQGGPVMTVERVDIFMGATEPQAECKMYLNGSMQIGLFYLPALKKASKWTIRSHALKDWLAAIIPFGIKAKHH